METQLTGEPVKQFSVFLQHRVGALLDIVKTLNEQSIQVLGLSVQDSIDSAIVRMVVTDPAAVRNLFLSRGIAFGECELLVVELKNGAAGLGQCLSSLLIAEVNIDFSYPLLTRPGGCPLIAFHADDNEVAACVLAADGFRTLTQADLSR